MIRHFHVYLCGVFLTLSLLTGAASAVAQTTRLQAAEFDLAGWSREPGSVQPALLFRFRTPPASATVSVSFPDVQAALPQTLEATPPGAPSETDIASLASTAVVLDATIRLPRRITAEAFRGSVMTQVSELAGGAGEVRLWVVGDSQQEQSSDLWHTSPDSVRQELERTLILSPNGQPLLAGALQSAMSDLATRSRLQRRLLLITDGCAADTPFDSDAEFQSYLLQARLAGISVHTVVLNIGDDCNELRPENALRASSALTQAPMLTGGGTVEFDWRSEAGANGPDAEQFDTSLRELLVHMGSVLVLRPQCVPTLAEFGSLTSAVDGTPLPRYLNLFANHSAATQTYTATSPIPVDAVRCLSPPVPTPTPTPTPNTPTTPPQTASPPATASTPPASGPPWALIIGGVVLVLALVGGFFGYRRWSGGPAVLEDDEDSDLPPDRGGWNDATPFPGRFNEPEVPSTPASVSVDGFPVPPVVIPDVFATAQHDEGSGATAALRRVTVLEGDKSTPALVFGVPTPTTLTTARRYISRGVGHLIVGATRDGVVVETALTFGQQASAVFLLSCDYGSPTIIPDPSPFLPVPTNQIRLEVRRDGTGVASRLVNGQVEQQSVFVGFTIVLEKHCVFELRGPSADLAGEGPRQAPTRLFGETVRFVRASVGDADRYVLVPQFDIRYPNFFEVGRGPNSSAVVEGVALVDPAYSSEYLALSTSHAQFWLSGGKLYVIDMSRNGTLVNGRAIPPGVPVDVQPDDYIQFAQFAVYFARRA